MNAITFTITLLEPLLATGLEGDPNAGVSLKYIAGSVLRGAIIGLYLRKGNEIDSGDEISRNLFFNGKVCYLNAYPQIIDQRSFPIPFAWQKRKDDDSNTFFNFSIKEREEKTSYKNLSFPFFAFESSNDVIPFSPKFRLAVHTQRDAEKGRSTSDDGAVFRYESIAEGTRFGGVIISEDIELLKTIKGLIDFENLTDESKRAVFGGSRSAGYGKADFREVKIIEDWKEFESVEKENDEISVYLLSNIILRDKNGNIKTELSAGDFGLANVDKIKEKTFYQTEVVGGFNQKWGLPLPQTISIKAGSVFTFAATETDILKDFTEKGIGERLSEGFGRIAFDITNSSDLNEVKSKPSPLKPVTINNSKIRDRILFGVLSQKLDSQLVKLTDNNSISGNLTNSQISRLRMFIRDMRINNNLDPNNLDNFFRELKGNGKSQFENAKVGSKSFIQWTKTNHFEKDWKIALGGKATTNQNLQNEYNLLLIDGILAKKAKERNKQ